MMVMMMMIMMMMTNNNNNNNNNTSPNQRMIEEGMNQESKNDTEIRVECQE